MTRLIFCIFICFLCCAGKTRAGDAVDGTATLPIVHIETIGRKMPTAGSVEAPEDLWGVGTVDNEYVKGRMIVVQADSAVYDSGDYAEDESGARTAGMRIRVRGNTSAHWAFPPYRIKLSQKGDPLDFGYEAKSWNLIRPMGSWGRTYYLLDSHVGRTVALTAGMDWQPEYKFVELYLNGDYRGIYLLSEVVERGDNRVDISKTDRFYRRSRRLLVDGRRGIRGTHAAAGQTACVHVQVPRGRRH